ncbi:unnamed protein product [Cuscuta campestris]|uniref:AIPP2-like SPOC-like domain-containing protein n=1 Tax=Cuscuta campestris TaxID=132261 RepID=A0A484KKD9_9ASTE|nr:unnamed protein product [Cuscuta campestris]
MTTETIDLLGTSDVSMASSMEKPKTSDDPDPMEGSDDSNDEEHDVKVCDICGDAGQEDLLAVCCKCTDGAEHTYCMREMLEEVPEGDWLCEECKWEQDMKTQKRNETCEVTSEISCAPKSQGLKSFSGSPKSQRTAVSSLSRGSSFKSSDKGKAKIDPLFAGTFPKSNSSSSRIGSPRIKPGDGVFPSKQKLVKESVSTNSKEGSISSMGKFMSLKPTSSSSGGAELIVQTPRFSHDEDTKSPRFSHYEDTKRQRYTKEDRSFERKSSLGPERKFNEEVLDFGGNSPAKAVISYSDEEKSGQAAFPKEDRPVVDAPVVNRPVVDAHVAKNSGETMNSTCDLKAAIEAAMLKKPGICRKSKANTDSDHQKRSFKCSLDILRAESLRSVDKLAISILVKTAIPKHQFIWRGEFEVRKSGNALDLCDGIQAHLSSCASPRVVDEVRKFPCKVLLNEVTRLSTWPLHFHEFGVREDNIALFFFAKDLRSYEKSYKVLLANLMKHDLALQCNFGGIELLIFPSNQLPENFQRWNMMFFLWGVFRGKKGNSSQYVHCENPALQVSEPASSNKEVDEAAAGAMVASSSKETVNRIESNHKSADVGTTPDNMDIDTMP